MIRPILAATSVAALMMAQPAAAQDAGTPTKQTLSAAYTGKVYSPYAHRNFGPGDVYMTTQERTYTSLICNTP